MDARPSRWIRVNASVTMQNGVRTYLCFAIEPGVQIVEHSNQLVCRALRGQRSEALNVGEQNATTPGLWCEKGEKQT